MEVCPHRENAESVAARIGAFLIETSPDQAALQGGFDLPVSELSLEEQAIVTELIAKNRVDTCQIRGRIYVNSVLFVWALNRRRASLRAKQRRSRRRERRKTTE